MNVVFLPAARRDILNQVAYLIDEFAYDAALRFPEAVLAAIEFIKRNPNAGTLRSTSDPRLRGLRSWAITGFEDVRVYYQRPDRQTIRVIRVLHGKRDLRKIFPPADN